MFTFSKKDAKSLAQKSELVQNSVLKNALLQLDSEVLIGGISGYKQVVYDRIVHDRHVSS